MVWKTLRKTTRAADQIVEQFVSEGVGGIALAPLMTSPSSAPAPPPWRRKCGMADSALKAKARHDFVKYGIDQQSSWWRMAVSSWESF
jgi:hypothetical protein